MFRDRQDAGQQLAVVLLPSKTEHPLVLALPRGGVTVGAEIARALECDFDVLLVKKLRAPFNPELAVGAVSEDGKPILNNALFARLGVDQRYIDNEVRERMGEIRDQQRLYRAVKRRISPRNRTVIIVDDGLATGATMRAAIQAVDAAEADAILVAVPGGAPDTVQELIAMDCVDDVICIEQPPFFGAVGELYRDFRQVEDSEVVEILKTFAFT